MSRVTSDRPFPRLKANQQTGSKPRCHLLTDGTRPEIASRLTALIERWGGVSAKDDWMPDGFGDTKEAQLHTSSKIIGDERIRSALIDWWFAVPGNRRTTTPNWDIASTCTVGNDQGILLVEAKAHDAELRNVERGKPLEGEDNKGVSMDSRRNHVRIGTCIQDASLALSAQTGLPWALSRDWNYQMANRFAWAWKVADLGIPVILVYLGFTGCKEMRKAKNRQQPIESLKDWQQLVESHSRPLFPQEVWETQWNVNGRSLIPLIRVVNQPLAREASPS